MNYFESYANYQTFVDEVYSQALNLGITNSNSVQTFVEPPDFFGVGHEGLPPLDITVSRGSLPTTGLYAGQLLLNMKLGDPFYRTFHVGNGLGGWTPLSSITELVHPGLRVLAGSVVTFGRDTTGVVTLRNNGDIIPTVGMRKTPVRIGLFGDSTADAYIRDEHDVEILTAPFPVSGTTTLGVYSEKFMLPILYPQAYVVAACGIGGENTTLMLARDTAVFSTERASITDMLNLDPDVIIYRGGSINDIALVTDANWQSVADTTFSRQKSLLGRMLAGNVPVLVQGILGYGTGASAYSAYGDAVRSSLVYLNSLTKHYCSQFQGKLYYLDPVQDGIQSIDGHFLVGNTDDGVHQNVTGGYLMAIAERRIIESLFGPSGANRYPGVNLIDNSLMAATAVQAHGTVATGITLYSANATLSDAKVETIDGMIFQTVLATFTAAANYVYFAITTPVLASSGILINDVCGFEFDFFIEPQDGLDFQPSDSAFFGQIYFQKVGFGYVLDAVKFTHPGVISTVFKGKMVLPPIQLTEAPEDLVVNAFSFSVPSDHTSGTIKVGVGNARMVKIRTAVQN